jgi:DNA-binding SARP family transcriptional activator/ABC-type branched-subunit amino acid transport system substrate-binding protein
MEFRILGPLEVAERGTRLELGRGKERSVLAILLLHANEVVSGERLIDELWREQPPATAAKTVQVYVSRLRKALAGAGSHNGPDGVLLTRGGGYVLRVEPGQLDAESFQQGLVEGERLLAAGAAQEASETLRRALALWRGPALADFTYEAFAELETARLEELRLVAVEQRIAADLVLGRHTAVVAELETLVARHPLRERFWEQLMLALYRSGRQTEALQAFQRARRVLLEDVGLEPGEPLRTLEQAILAHDPTLALASSTTAPAAHADGDVVRTPHRRRPRPLPAFLTRHRLALVACGAVVLAASAIAAASELLGGSQRARSAPPGLLAADSVGRIDPRTGALVANVAVPGGPARVALAGAQPWVASDRSRTVSTVDARKHAVSAVITPGSFPTGVALGEGAGWVLDGTSGRLLKINPAYPSEARSVTIDRRRADTYLPGDRSVLDNPWSLATGLGGVWVTDGSSRLIRVNPHTSSISAAIDVGGSLNGVAVGEGAIWTIAGRAATVSRIDPRTLRVTDRIPIVSRPGAEAPYPIAIAVGLGSVWVLNANVATVTRIDVQQRGITTTVPIFVQHGPVRLAVGGGAVWVANGDGTLSRINPASNVATTRAIGRRLLDVAAGPGGVWVAAGAGSGPGSTQPQGSPAGALRALPTSRCSPLYSQAGDRPRLLIASDLQLQGPGSDVQNQMAQAIRFVLAADHFRAGRYAVAYQSCDDFAVGASSPQTTRCESNTKTYANDPSVIAVIGPYQSSCAVLEVPIADRARPGPLPVLSPSATYVGLTRHWIGLAPHEPDRYYPVGTRNFVRILPSDDFQAAADAMLARRLGLTRIFMLKEHPFPHHHDPYAVGITTAFRRAAQKLGIAIAGDEDWSGANSSYMGLARKIKRSGADGVFLGGGEPVNGGTLVKDLRAELGNGVRLLAPDGFYTSNLADATGAAGDGMTVSVAGVAPQALTGTGARFVKDFGATLGQTPQQPSVYAAQATQLLLDAIRRSNATRASVNHELFTSRMHKGILGDFAITPTGDTTTHQVTIYQLAAGTLHRMTVISVPPRLVED